MDGTHYILANLWIAIIAFFLLFYAITDGADLGLGIISLFTGDEAERSFYIGAIESTWHTNQTWLVILGGMVFGAFPLFYSVVFSALYIPTMVMLFSLIIRGIALDYEEHSIDKAKWSLAFAWGSLFTAVSQGFALGGLLGGIRVEGDRFAGGVWDWLTPFSVLVAAGVVAGYIMLGANFLVLKGDGEIQQKGYRYSLAASLLVGPISVLVYLWMTVKHPFMVEKFTAFPDAFWVIPAPALALAAYLLLLYSLQRRSEIYPFFLNAAIVIFSFAGISLALYPHMIPNVVARPVEIVDAAASSSTLIFMTIVIAIVLPIVLIYNGYNQFWVFRGKIHRYYKK